MGKWLAKFSERAQVSTDSIDTLSTTSTLSVPNRAHSENISVSLNAAGDPAEPCPACGSGQFWQVDNGWHCRACDPDMPLTATTLTLDCHTLTPSRTWDAERVDALLAESIPDPKTNEALSLLAENPTTRYALTTDESDADHVIVHLAIRDQAHCQLRVARDRWDGLEALELLARLDAEP